MFKNYIRIAWRTIWRSRGLSMINIAGLSLGLATTLLIVLFIRHETGYDSFHKNAANIVRVVFNGRMQGGEIHEANVMPMVAPTLKMDFPEVEDAVRKIHLQCHQLKKSFLAFCSRSISGKPNPLDKADTAMAIRFVLVGSVLASSIHLLK